MPDQYSPEPKPAGPGHLRTAAILCRIAAGGFALVSIFAAIDARWSLSVTYLSMCVVYIAVSQMWARKAQQVDEAFSGGLVKQ